MSKLFKEMAYLLFSIYRNVENIRPQKLTRIFGLLIVLIANLGHFAWMTLMWGQDCGSSVDSWFPSLILNSVIVSGAGLCAPAAGSSSSMQIRQLLQSEPRECEAWLLRQAKALHRLSLSNHATGQDNCSVLPVQNQPLENKTRRWWPQGGGKPQCCGSELALFRYRYNVKCVSTNNCLAPLLGRLCFQSCRGMQR